MQLTWKTFSLIKSGRLWNVNWKQGFTQRPAWKVSPGEKQDKIGWGSTTWMIYSIIINFSHFYHSKSIEHWESWNEVLTKLDHLRHSGNLGKYDDQPTASGGKNQAATWAPHCPSFVALCPQFDPIIATPLPEPPLSLICGLFLRLERPIFHRPDFFCGSLSVVTKLFTGLIHNCL